MELEERLLDLVRDGEQSTDLLLDALGDDAPDREELERRLLGMADRRWVRGHRRRFNGMELAADPCKRRAQSQAWWWELLPAGREEAERRAGGR